MRRVLVGLFLLAACHGEAEAKKNVVSPSGLRMGAVRFETPRGPWVVKVEIADTPQAEARGLMFRRSLEPDSGMIFVFPDTQDRAFWMHNTLIPLDMIFLDESRTVVGVVANAPPQTDTLQSPHKPSRYVVEVAGGEAAVHAVGPGTTAVFIDIGG
ncbi:MAG TPA: DUF192 domain-containing protein [Myxococcales bacterium]|nr:DUF192 domain-containing protein [Myxococcales bacterium]